MEQDTTLVTAKTHVPGRFEKVSIAETLALLTIGEIIVVAGVLLDKTHHWGTGLLWVFEFSGILVFAFLYISLGFIKTPPYRRKRRLSKDRD
jgi:hypothetical protein